MKRTTTATFVVLLLGMVFQGYAQELPQVIPPSPTVANLMSFEEVPIDYYSGQPNISIPLYTKQIGPSASLSLALRYNTQGVKVDSRSSWVGTGWSLDIGGVISRTVRGIPDDDPADADTRLGVWHNADFWNYDALGNNTLIGYNPQTNDTAVLFNYSEKQEFLWKAKGSSFDQYDTELDLFQFSLLGASGRFVIIKEAGVLVPKLLDKSQNVKIELAYNQTTLAISSFTVTDAYGYKYVFDQKENSTAEPVTATRSQKQGSDGLLTGTGEADYTYTSAWYLKEIKASNDIVLATFAYSPFTENYTASRTRTENHVINIHGIPSLPDALANSYNGGILKPRVTVSDFTMTINGLKPASITFKDNTSIVLSVAAGSHPETGGKILDYISLRNVSNTEVKRISLTTETSGGRLWLNKVAEIAGSDTLEHAFDYHQKQYLPAFGSGADVWGYYNGTELSIIPQAFNPDLIKTGLLTTIDFPTGGRKTFEFEHNTYSHGAGVDMTEEQFWQNPENDSIKLISKAFSGVPLGTGLSVNDFGAETFNLDIDQKVYFDIDLEGTEVNPGSGSTDNYLANPTSSGPFDPVNNMVIKVEDSVGNIVVSIPIKNEPFETWAYLPAGNGYTMYVITPQMSGWSIDGQIDIYYRNKKASLESNFWYGGGVRIKETAFYNNPSDLTPQRKWNYSYQDANDSTKSSGAVDALLGSLRREYEVNNRKYLYSTIIDDPGAFAERSIDYMVYSQGLNAQITKGGYVGYKTVKVTETGNGTTTFTYTNPKDYKNPASVFTYPFDPPENLDFKRGLLLNSQVLNEQGDTLKRTVNVYDFDSNTSVITTSRRLYNPEQCAWTQFYDLFSFFVRSETQSMPTGGQLNLPIIPASNWQNCGGTSGLYFKNEDVETNWAQLKESIEYTYTYPGGTPQVSNMRTAYKYNALNFQQSEVSRYVKENGTEVEYKTKMYYPVNAYPDSAYTIAQNAEITKMANLNNINTLIFQESYRDAVLQDRLQNVFDEFHTNLVAMKEVRTARGVATLESRMFIHGYDNQGNILEVSKTDDTHIVYLWGYDQTLPVAQIQNATYADIEALSGFGTDFHAGAGGLTAAQETTLRSLPNAMVTTMTYDRTFGMLSQTGPNGITTFYEYDALGRLQYVKDQDGNILKMNEYSYQVNANSTGY